jgi:hypothetical protein
MKNLVEIKKKIASDWFKLLQVNGKKIIKKRAVELLTS